MALCRTCSKVIPCHCHLSPPVEVAPGVYLADPNSPQDRGNVTNSWTGSGRYIDPVPVLEPKKQEGK
jgi:hypothetical protein